MSDGFYGGKQGFSFIIVKSFSSVEEMIENFKKGPNYSTVHFNEHVLINTENKNDSTNGRLYRRGYDYANNLGGAVYIGTIVGPAGRAPMLELTTVEEVKQKQSESNFEDRYTEGSYAPPISLIPGKDGEKYNDEIEWACCCIRDENGENSTAYIGFKFPYTVIDFTAESVNPYYNRSNNTNNFTNQNLTTRVDDKVHPFYERWKVSVPKGIQGDAFKNLRVITANSSIKDYEGKQDDISNNRKVLVYDYYHYDKDESGEPETIYLGDYNMINSIRIDEDGTITVGYTHNNSLVYSKLIRWVNRIYFKDSDNKFHVLYNTGVDEAISDIIRFIDDVYIDNEDDKFHISYTNGDNEAIGEPINFIEETAINETNYHLLIYYSSSSYRNLIPSDKKVTYKGKEGWLDLGSIKEDSGILVGLNVLPSESEGIEEIQTAINYLNERYPNGLIDPKYYGKIVTIGESDKDKYFYAFDYDKNEWYYLGAFKENRIWDLVCAENDPDLDNLKSNLAEGGLWFIVEGEDD